MRQAHRITLILPEEITLETFNKIISDALKQSKATLAQSTWNPITMEEEYDEFEVSKYDLEPIVGRDIAMEFKKRKRR